MFATETIYFVTSQPLLPFFFFSMTFSRKNKNLSQWNPALGHAEFLPPLPQTPGDRKQTVVQRDSLHYFQGKIEWVSQAACVIKQTFPWSSLWLDLADNWKHRQNLKDRTLNICKRRNNSIIHVQALWKKTNLPMRSMKKPYGQLHLTKGFHPFLVRKDHLTTLWGFFVFLNYIIIINCYLPVYISHSIIHVQLF